MSVTLEIAYYNTFILSGGASVGTYHVEESRIKGAFNGTSVDYGVKAHITDEEYTSRTRENAMIYSGVYNSKTKVNNTNQFPSGEEITRAVDIASGSIQKLYAEDNRLNIFQENKVSRALIDKDIIFTAEGGQLTVGGSKVISQILPYAGKYGISKNPESFAYFGGRMYFADKNRGLVARLSGDGIEEISRYGMNTFFKDNLKNANAIHGSYDSDKAMYLISLQGSNMSSVVKANNTTSNLETQTDFITAGFTERVKGWVSLYSYKPKFGFHLHNKFYTCSDYDVYEHHRDDVQLNNFYGATYKDPSTVTLLFNDNPNIIKNFLTINYEGSSNWSMDSAVARSHDNSTAATSYTAITEEAYKIPKKGVTIIDENSIGINVGFEEKENKYFKHLKNKASDVFHDDAYFTNTGLKGEYLTVKMQYSEPTAIANEEKAELFSVSSEAQISSK